MVPSGATSNIDRNTSRCGGQSWGSTLAVASGSRVRKASPTWRALGHPSSGADGGATKVLGVTAAATNGRIAILARLDTGAECSPKRASVARSSLRKFLANAFDEPFNASAECVVCRQKADDQEGSLT